MKTTPKVKSGTDVTVLELFRSKLKIQNKKGFYRFSDFTRSAYADLVLSLIADTKNDSQRDHIVGTIFNTSGRLFVMTCYQMVKRAELECPNEWHKLRPGVKGLEILLNKTKPIAYIDPQLFDKLYHTPPPQNCVISNFFASEILIIFPTQNVHNIVAAWFSVVDNRVEYYVYLKENSSELNLVTEHEKLNTPYHGHFTLGVPIEEDFALNSSNSWVISFLLWQQSMHDKGHEVLEIDAPTKKMGFGKNSKELIVPRVIGEGYKPKVIRNYDPVGTHASPRTHWRSGHWRQQPFGSKEDPKYKTIWIEPVLINA